LEDSNRPVAQVRFFRESNGIPGLQWSGEGLDALIHVDSDPSDGWRTTLSSTELPIGSHTFYAVGSSSAGAMSNIVSAVVNVTDRLAWWQNPLNPLDVNDDGQVSPIDALLTINFLNSNPGNPVPPQPPFFPPPFYDVSGDHQITPIDALLVINYLNSVPDGEPEWAAQRCADFPGCLVDDPPILSFASVSQDGWHLRREERTRGTVLRLPAMDHPQATMGATFSVPTNASVFRETGHERKWGGRRCQDDDDFESVLDLLANDAGSAWLPSRD